MQRAGEGRPAAFARAEPARMRPAAWKRSAAFMLH